MGDDRSCLFITLKGEKYFLRQIAHLQRVILTKKPSLVTKPSCESERPAAAIENRTLKSTSKYPSLRAAQVTTLPFTEARPVFGFEPYDPHHHNCTHAPLTYTAASHPRTRGAPPVEYPKRRMRF
ncbi:hypothetical protein AVEN_15412-1 [Araneus ventricosus]|uniref:Uncharacterized protein n=1 Tax=Araneus ventricosus TaxID=182803 RepID=A0A4Y2CRS6_ARAVE|nr:hypothetical protein AVEN_15412-1 [Araneus ventricosus]